MKRRVVRRMRKKTTKKIMRGSKMLVVWEYGLRHRHARTKENTIIAKVLVAFCYGFDMQQGMEQPVSKGASISWPKHRTKYYDIKGL